MKILLTGGAGQLGRSLVATLSHLAEITATTQSELDLSDAGAIERCVAGLRPDLIINAAAYTRVDDAEVARDLAFRINGEAPGTIGKAALQAGAAVLHFSTDYVFNGANPRPYLETDEPCPVNAYGESKLAGERALRDSQVPHLILRVGWLYAVHGRNFFNTILHLAGERDCLDVVDDQVGAPTTTDAVAAAVATILGHCQGAPRDMMARNGGLYHFACGGNVTWKGFAEEILRHARATGQRLRATEVRGIAGNEYPAPAKRPKNSRLDTALVRRTFGINAPDWKAALADEFRKLSAPSTHRRPHPGFHQD